MLLLGGAQADTSRLPGPGPVAAVVQSVVQHNRALSSELRAHQSVHGAVPSGCSFPFVQQFSRLGWHYDSPDVGVDERRSRGGGRRVRLC